MKEKYLNNRKININQIILNKKISTQFNDIIKAKILLDNQAVEYYCSTFDLYEGTKYYLPKLTQK